MLDGDAKNDGKFKAGNPGGPGRPSKKQTLDAATLRDLAVQPTGPELYMTAMALSDREKWLAAIEMDMSSEIAKRMRTLIAISDAAAGEIVRRLRTTPL